MAALTRWVLSHKYSVFIFWLILALVGGATSQKAVKALSQKFDKMLCRRTGAETKLHAVTHVLQRTRRRFSLQFV